MTTLSRGQGRRETALCLAGLFLVLFLLSGLYPVTGDDWYREALGASLQSPWDLFQEVAGRWAATNSRILGNLLAYSAGSRPLLRQLYQAALTLGLIALLARVTGIGGWGGLLLWTAGVLSLPRDIFAQTHAWAAGFFNFVPPVVVVLACLVLVQPVLDGGKLEETPQRWAGLFLLGFAHQLFVEHSTLYALCAALVLLVWYRLERNRWSPSLLLLLLGCVLGAALLFSSPSYRMVSGDGSYYQSGLSGGLAGLIATARVNLPTVARYLILDCPVLYISLTALASVLGTRFRGWPHRLLDIGLFLSLLWMVCGPHPFAAACVWALLLVLALALWLPDRVSRARTLFFLLSAGVAAGPLLFVNPIGPRCLFFPYILLLAAAGCILRCLEPGRMSSLFTGLVPAALAAAVLGACFSIYLPIHRLELRRTGILEEALASGAAEAVLPPYGQDGGWLWDGDNSEKIGQVYYRETPGDLEIRFFAPCPEED
ncbi:MAG: hypothetical protein HFF58_04960 [Lawsonibacter sp.]|nr:hypothetical protein [Lawsonibacter sp.]